MTITAAGFPGQVTDREWATILGLIGNDGTVGYNVSAVTNQDRTVSVSSGVSNVGGVLLTSNATETVQVPTNPSSNPRKDYVILRVRWADQLAQLTYRTGTPSASPQPPWASVRRDPGDQYEVVLAELDVAPGQGSFSSGDVVRKNTPPATGFYWLSSIGQAPHPSDGALIWHNPSGTLYVGTPSGYQPIAGGSTGASALPSPSAVSGWVHTSTYQSRAGHVSVNIDVHRTGGNTSGNNVRLGILPAGSRPPNQIYRTVMNQHSGESFIVEIRTSGLISCIGMQANTTQRIRGGFSFLAGG